MTHSLKPNGLSLSQAQSLSNICFQRASDIQQQLEGINNYKKSIKIGNEEYVDVQPKPVPANLIELIMEKAALHALQGFLMVNIKAKEALIKAEQAKPFTSDLEAPKRDELEKAELTPLITETQAWESLTAKEYNEYLKAEAFAAHIGQFIHKNSPLDTLRKELPTLKTLEWIVIKEGEKTPLKVEPHHTAEQLLDLHNKLAGEHRKFEQRVNYFKARIKNYVTEKNAVISKENSEKQNKVNAANEVINEKYSKEFSSYSAKILAEKQTFEAERLEEIKRLAALRIEIDPEFQLVVDKYKELIKDEEK